MKNKSRFSLFFTGIAIVVVWVVLLSQVQPPTKFELYLVKSDVLIISGEDVVWYNWTSHEVKLTDEGIQRVKGLDLYQQEFVLKLDGKELYTGMFWSYVSSRICSGIVILDILLIQDGITDVLVIEPFYPPGLFNGIDPRNALQVFAYFSHVGKLV